MKLLLDTCVWRRAVAELSAAGHDVVWSGEWPVDPGDTAILMRAYEEGRTLVTLDKDFGEIAIVRGQPHRGIIRLVGFSARQQGTACLRALAAYADQLQAGAIVTVEPGRARIRPADTPT